MRLTHVHVNTIGCGSGANAEAEAEAEIQVGSVVLSAHSQLPPPAAAAAAAASAALTHNAHENTNIKRSAHTIERTRFCLQALVPAPQCPPPFSYRHPIARLQTHDELDASMQYQAADSAAASTAPLNPFRGGGGSPYSPPSAPSAWPLNSTQQQQPVAAAAGSVPPRTPLQALQAKLDSFDRRQLMLIIVFIAIFLDNMLLTTVGAPHRAAPAKPLTDGTCTCDPQLERNSYA